MLELVTDTDKLANRCDQLADEPHTIFEYQTEWRRMAHELRDIRNRIEEKGEQEQ